ncbi:hypothetical protein QNO07_03615 [Streptomyces sp. 549]|uniref:hypothetical protein n=1 Tax=Streptomyces sp. 549 TaxID=3049076 RepID=UPI0024C2D96B|nr:hypothetical protein [Streptomyces sp. 549]MDK1472522.1 hypothetical protein [Streptomyces sp. 549]
MTSSEPPSPSAPAELSPGNRTETAFGSVLLFAVIGFLLLFVADARGNDTLAAVGRLLHWAAGAGVLVIVAVTRTALRRWTSGFDWIFAAMWIVLTIPMWLNGDL